MNELNWVEDWGRLQVVVVPFLIRCGVAAVCGAMIGIERELKAKPAGFRTNILICVGAAMYMLVGLLLDHETTAETDASRIAAQVVTGIGFLGAGCILQARGRVTGLTSAATIWVVAAIGLVSGAGFPILATIGAVLVVLTLVVLGVAEKKWLQPAAARHRREAPDEQED